MKDFKLFSYLFSLTDLERKCHLQMRAVRAGPLKDTVLCLTFLLEQKHFISSGCLWGPKGETERTELRKKRAKSHRKLSTEPHML